MKIAMVRDIHLNPWDIGNYYGVIDNGAELYCCGNVLGDIDWAMLESLYPKAKFVRYNGLHEVFHLNPDVIDVPDLFYSFSRYYLDRFDKVAVVAWENLPGKNWPYRQEWRKAALVVGRSVDALAACKADGSEAKSVVIPGSVDTDVFYPGEGRDGSVLFCGRLVPEKGLYDVIWALAGTTTQLKVVGAGDQRPFREAADRYGVNASFFGSITDRELLAEIFRQSSILCVPSLPLVSHDPFGNWVEQFGQVYIEAMASGTPVVAYRSGAVIEVVPSGCGVLVDPRSFDQLRSAIHFILNSQDAWDKLSLKCVQIAHDVYSNGVVGEKIVGAYSSITH